MITRYTISTCSLSKTSSPRHMLSPPFPLCLEIDLKVMARYESYMFFVKIRYDTYQQCTVSLPAFTFHSSLFLFLFCFVLLCFAFSNSVLSDLKNWFFFLQLFILKFQNFNYNKSQNSAMDAHIAFTQVYILSPLLYFFFHRFSVKNKHSLT